MNIQNKHFARVEDDALLRGAGRYSDDVHQAGQAHAVFVRSPHASARIASIDVASAAAAPGVLAVVTAADIKDAGIGPFTRHPPIEGRNGTKLYVPPRPVLAAERVMHVGDPVAMVVAETFRQAQDAAELVIVDYDEAPAVIDAREAIKDGAPQLWPEAKNNIVLDWPGPVPSADNERAVDESIKGAKHVARVSHFSQRIMAMSMEPRGATASFDAQTGDYTLRVGSQGAGAVQGGMLAVLPKDTKLRVLTDDVGGGFGMKSGTYPEYFALLVAAKNCGRTVHWMSTRSESFITDNQARDTYIDAELALDEAGKFLALRVRHLANQGAYIGPVGAHINTSNFARCLPTVYDIPKIDVSAVCVVTNTVPIGAYRGAGRPEANYVLERVIEEAARVSGIDAVKLRKKNLIAKSKMPFKTPVGTTYDSGDFKTVMEKALALADYDGFNKRKRESAKRKKHRGIGVSMFLEHAGSMPNESAVFLFPGGETMTLGLYVGSTGQSHATVFPRLVAERLGIDPSQIKLHAGDTNLNLSGFAAVGSRCAMVVSHTLLKTIDAVIEKGIKIAATLLQAGDAEVGFSAGTFEVKGTSRKISLFDVASRAHELNESLDTKANADTPQTFPNGCHIAEVEIDPDTGMVEIARYTAVDDCGNLLDETVVKGQVVGALAQGLGQVLLENGVYDSSGQLVSGSFMDYAMPRAHNMPIEIHDALHPVPATTNPLGVKGVGEAGTTASLAAIMIAIGHAVPNGAAAHMDMPATPAKVWAACEKAKTLPAS